MLSNQIISKKLKIKLLLVRRNVLIDNYFSLFATVDPFNKLRDGTG